MEILTHNGCYPIDATAIAQAKIPNPEENWISRNLLLPLVKLM
jgi:hypothetical protein